MAFEPHKLTRLKVRNKDYLFFYQVFRRIPFPDAGNDLALFAKINLQLQQLFGTLHPLGGNDLPHAQINLRKFINGHRSIVPDLQLFLNRLTVCPKI